ncbi:MAG: ATP-binding protein [Firmicutes bacterium]|nr:ATP-binding protein [Bacillota bacterium]
MYRSLYFKIILIFVVFMITVMAVVGTVLLNSVFKFYMDDFSKQIGEYLGGDTQLTETLIEAMADDDFPEKADDIMRGYGTFMGIDIYRNYYILGMDGTYLSGSDDESGIALRLTPNLIRSMKKEIGSEQVIGAEYSDYARYLTNGDKEYIIYVKDTQEEMRALGFELFSIVLQSVFFGLLISVIMSFFLAKAITRPIQNLTKSADLIASGEFTNGIEVVSNDEIGTLTETFNYMNTVIKNTITEAEGERQKLETVFAYLKDGVIAFSDKGKIIQINKAAIDMLGDNFSENLTFSEMLEHLYVDFAQAYVSNENNEKSYIIRDVEMGSKAVDINIGSLRYIEDNVERKGCIVVLHDITARYELDKSRREFVANVSHELRTPLTVIKGATETILTYPDMDENMKTEFLKSSIEESNRMLNIIMDLLTLSRLDGKRTQWKISEFDLRASLEHLCTTLKVRADEHCHTISMESDGQPCLINGDKDRLEQVFINIITNAIKYTPDNGLIEVSLESGAEKVKVSIKDNGIGIPSEDLPHIFDRFYRVEKSRTAETGGTGLGLSIAKEIIDAHGGKIKIISASGKGTEVVIILPRKTSLDSSE